MLSGSLLSYLKKREISRNGHSLSLVVTRSHLLSLVVIRYTTRCHSLSLVVIGCHLLFHSLSLVVPLVVICCHSLYYSLSLVVTRCTTRLPFYKRSFKSMEIYRFSETNNKIIYLFFNLYAFQWNLKRHVFWHQWRHFQFSAESS